VLTDDAAGALPVPLYGTAGHHSAAAKTANDAEGEGAALAKESVNVA